MSDSVFEIREQELIRYRGSEAHVTVPPQVLVVGSQAFADCPELRSVTLPHTVSLVRTQAFYHCPNLTDIYMNGRLTRLDAHLFCGMPARFTIHYNGPDYLFRDRLKVEISKEITSSGDYYHPSSSHFEVYEEITCAHLFGEPEGGSFECRVLCDGGAVLQFTAQSQELWTEHRKG